MIFTKTITLNSFVDQKGYLRETDLPFYLKINRFVTTDSYSGFSKQFLVVRNDENRESLRKVELLKWLLCDDLFYLIFSQCFEITGKLKQSMIDGIETNVAYTQIMSPILNKSKRRPTTVNLMKRISEYIVSNPSILQTQMNHLKSNIQESEFFSSIYAADKTYYDYLVIEKAFIQGKFTETEQANAILRLLRTSYDDKYHGNNNVVKSTLCRSLGWDIPTTYSAELSFYRHLTSLVIESITDENEEIKEVLQQFVGSNGDEKKSGYDRWDYEKPFTELHNTIQHASTYPGELFRVSTGFLTTSFYKYLFTHAKERLYFATPANDNLFNPETINDLKILLQRAKNGRFDFKCMYWSPDESNNFLDTDPNPALLRQQITSNIKNARECISSMHLTPQDYIRIHPKGTGQLMIVIDDVMLFIRVFEKGIYYSNEENKPFYVLHTDSKGAFMEVQDFLWQWEKIGESKHYSKITC